MPPRPMPNRLSSARRDRPAAGSAPVHWRHVVSMRHRTTTNSSKFMIAFTTVVIAAKSARGNASSDSDSPTAEQLRGVVAVPGEQIPLLGEEPREDARFRLVRDAGRSALETPRGFARASSSGKRFNSCSASTRAASTNCGSLSRTSDWSGVAVTSRLRGADLAGHRVEGDHRRRRRRAPPERVQAAAVEGVSRVLLVRFPGAGLLPEAGGLIRLHARAADRAIEETAGRERAVADLLGHQPGLRAPGEQLVVRVAAVRCAGHA